MPTKVSFERAVNKFRALGNVLHRPLRDVLDSGARVMAIEFAKTSQPFGTGHDAKEAGEKAVATDISKVYATPGKAWEKITDPGPKAAFWKAYMAGEFAVAERFLNDFGSGNLRGVPWESFDGGSAHRARRNAKTGRVPGSQRPVMIVTNPKALASYVKKVQGDVGTGKAGWADVARQISGSVRGLRQEGDITANWITRKSSLGFGKVIRGGTDEHPTITIQSRVPYADNILNGAALARAKEIGHHRMLENLRIAVNAETRKLNSAA